MRHKNKYLVEAKSARKKGIHYRRCLSKVKYDSYATAKQKGQECYRCPDCGGWHRTGSLLTQVKKYAKRSRQQ